MNSKPGVEPPAKDSLGEGPGDLRCECWLDDGVLE